MSATLYTATSSYMINDHHELNLGQSSKEAFSEIRKESSDIYNRLHSIKEDISFVDNVAKFYSDFPLLPNLRCGAWYTNPKIATPIPAYFKSTDGHFSNWSFNLRRPNLHLLPLISERKGMILVDSTRSGKKIPDALSKTVPIWCAVVNRAVALRFPRHDIPWDTALYTPPATVSAQEYSQIASRIDDWARSLADSSYDLPDLTLPLRPIWITPSTTTFPDVKQMEYLPVICLSASKQISEGMERRTSNYSYIQGSADDHEAWGMGLTPEIFWLFYDRILSTPREALPRTVLSLISTSKSYVPQAPPSGISKTHGRLMLCATSDLSDAPGSSAHLIITTDLAESGGAVNEPKLVIRAIAGKKGQHQFLVDVLPRSIAFIRESLARGSCVCISCDTGNDIGAGVALVALQLFFDESGVYDDRDRMANKKTLRTRLEWIIADRPSANPSRSTLKRVNEFLLSPIL